MSWGLGITVLIFYGAVAALAYLLGWIFDLPSLWHIEPRPPGPLPPPLGLLLGIALGLLTHGASVFVRRRFGWLEGFYQQLRLMLGSPGTGLVALIALSSATAEELLFRGALLPLIGLIPQAVLFGVLHIGPGREFRFWPFYAMAMGILLGLLHQVSGSLLPPILAHFTVNFFGLLSLREKGLGREDAQ